TTRLDNTSFLVSPGRDFIFISHDFHTYRYNSFEATENSTMNMSLGSGDALGLIHIHSGSTIYAGPGLFFNISAGTINPALVFEDHSAVMHFNNAIFKFFTPGAVHEVALTNGTVIIEGKVQFRHQVGGG